jgi:hypothetical protein
LACPPPVNAISIKEYKKQTSKIAFKKEDVMATQGAVFAKGLGFF